MAQNDNNNLQSKAKNENNKNSLTRRRVASSENLRGMAQNDKNNYVCEERVMNWEKTPNIFQDENINKSDSERRPNISKKIEMSCENIPDMLQDDINKYSSRRRRSFVM